MGKLPQAVVDVPQTAAMPRLPERGKARRSVSLGCSAMSCFALCASGVCCSASSSRGNVSRSSHGEME